MSSQITSTVLVKTTYGSTNTNTVCRNGLFFLLDVRSTVHRTENFNSFLALFHHSF